MNWLRTSLAAAALAASLASAPAQAIDFSFTGALSQDDEVQLFNFGIGATSTVTLRTWSYAGGTNAAGATIAAGGFDPILALFDGAGMLIDQNDDGGPAHVPADAETGNNWDTWLQLVDLPAGTYTVAVMQYDNLANGPNLSNGFARSGLGNFTPTITTCPDAQPSFNDVSGVAGCGRTGNWAFDILNVNEAVVVETPEPASLALLGAGLLGLAGLRRRRG